MSADAILNLACGGLCFLASFCVGLHQILLGPDRPNYPKGSTLLQIAMFAWCGFLGVRGAELVSFAWAVHPAHVTFPQFGASALLCAVHGLLLHKFLHQWLPATLQTRVQRWWAIASCAHRRSVEAERRRNNAPLHPGVPPAPEDAKLMAAALFKLSVEGVRVIGPGEPPSVLTQQFPHEMDGTGR